MNLLPELIIEIFRHSNNVGISSVYKVWHQLSLSRIKRLYLEYFINGIPNDIIDTFGYIKYPTLRLRSCGDYIDFIRADHPDMMLAPIMMGIDPYKRRFYCIKYKYKNVKNVVTIFQRYSNNLTYWRGCGNYNPSGYFDTSYGPIDYPLLKSLIQGTSSQLTLYH